MAHNVVRARPSLCSQSQCCSGSPSADSSRAGAISQTSLSRGSNLAVTITWCAQMEGPHVAPSLASVAHC